MESIFLKLDIDKSVMALGPIVPLIHDNVIKLHDFLHKCKADSKKVLILWDVDFDGIISGKIADHTVSDILGRDSVINKINKTKTHGLTRQMLNYIKSNQDIELVLIVDAGTNDTPQIHELLSIGKLVAVIDHHTITTPLTEHDNYLLINSHQSPYGQNVPCAILVKDIMNSLRVRNSMKPLTIYDEVSVACIVSDVCKRDSYNVNLLLKYFSGDIKKSPLLDILLKKNRQSTLRNLISATSKFNALIRRLGPEKLLGVMLSNDTIIATEVAKCNMYKQDNESIIKELINESSIYELRNIVLVLVTKREVQGSYSRNYLGITASKLASANSKPTLVLANNNVNFESYRDGQEYCYSARDPFNRDLLSVVQNVGIDASGHPPAFGGILTKGFVDVMQELDLRLNNDFKSRPTAYSNVVEVGSLQDMLDLYGSELNAIALWNSLNLDVDKIGFKTFNRGTISKHEKYNKLIFNELTAFTFDKTIQSGDPIIVFPEWNGKVEYTVKRP